MPYRAVTVHFRQCHLEKVTLDLPLRLFRFQQCLKMLR
jgi:hypothetical protein